MFLNNFLWSEQTVDYFTNQRQNIQNNYDCGPFFSSKKINILIEKLSADSFVIQILIILNLFIRFILRKIKSQ